MAITVEAVYERGVFRPKTPPPELKDHDLVRLTVEPVGLIGDQRRSRIEIDLTLAQAIAENDSLGPEEG